MGFNRANVEKYIMASLLGAGMIVGGLSSTDRWWIAIGGVVLGGTLLFAAIDLYFMFRRRSRDAAENDSPPSKRQLVLMLPLVLLIAAALVVLNGSEGIVIAALLLAAYAVLMLLEFGLPSGSIPLGKISFRSGPITLGPRDDEGSPAPHEDAQHIAELLKTAIQNNPGATITRPDGTPATEAEVQSALEALDAATAGKPLPRADQAQPRAGEAPRGTVASWNIQLGPEQLKSISVEQVLKAALTKDLGALIDPEAPASGEAAQPPDTLQVIKAAFSDNPDALLTPSGEAKSHLESYRFEAALVAADRAIAGRAAAENLLLRAEVLLSLGAAAEALSDIDRALAMKPQVSGAPSLRGRALLELGRLDEAIAVLATGEGPETPAWASYTLAEGYRLRGLATEAQAAYEEAAIRGMAESNWDVRRVRGIGAAALAHMGKPDIAAETAGKELVEAPSEPNVLFAKAIVEMKRGSPQAALAALEQACATNPHLVVRALSDPEFASLAADAAGRGLLERAKEQRDRVLAQVRARAAPPGSGAHG